MDQQGYLLLKYIIHRGHAYIIHRGKREVTVTAQLTTTPPTPPSKKKKYTRSYSEVLELQFLQFD